MSVSPSLEFRRRRVAILAADLCGYSRLVAQDEAGTLTRLIEDRGMIAGAAGVFGGRIFNTAGDAILVEFASAREALDAAVSIQRRVEARERHEPEARRMRYRIGITLGEVIEDGEDLLGDAVNVAARLEKLAEPGGICLSGAAREAAGAMPYAIRNIGAQRLKNMPQPVQAWLVPPQAIGLPRSARRWPAVAAAAVGIALAAGAVAALSIPRPGADAFVFPPEAVPPTEPRPPAHRDVTPGEIPFVSDAERAAIGSALRSDPDSAVAISQRGRFGTAPGGGDLDRAGAAALRACFDDGGVNCRLYALDGAVVWPEPFPPLPPQPWVDPGAPRTPFDASRIAGLGDERRRLATEYGVAKGSKALALGPRKTWFFASDRHSPEEAIRVALDRCGASVGSPCRIVAVGDSFVVPLRKP